ncbi:acetolactate decarboxylase [Fundidesulfovibrio butyratiphilus]
MTMRRLCCLFCILMLLSCTRQPAPSDPALQQYSTLEALSAGVFDGQMSLAELSRKGDMGLGTYDGLNGEMILLNGVFYRAKADCTLEQPSRNEETPFAAVVFFKPQQTVTVEHQASLADLSKTLEATLPSPRVFAAVRLHGTFDSITIRSVAPSSPPFPTLAKALEKQQVRKLENVTGTMVAIYCPPQSGTLAVPGWHIHFVRDGADLGGHVLAAKLATGQAKVMVLRDLILQLPAGGDFDTRPSDAQSHKQALAKESADGK